VIICVRSWLIGLEEEVEEVEGLVENAEVMRIMQCLEARLDVIEGDRQRDPDDVSEDEESQEEEAVAVQEPAELRMLRQVLGSTSRPKPDISNYSGGLNPEELIDWINDMEKFFEYEEMDEEKKVKFVVTKLKGHATLWWDGVQAERRKKNKQKIKSWDRMVAKLRGKFLPQDYQLSLFRQMQNLRQRLMSVREYTKEFYKVNIRAGYVEDTAEKISRYMNGLRMDIQDEISMLTPRKVEEAYQLL
jgi:hypothetical protein